MNFPVAFIGYLVLRSCLTYRISRLIYLISLYILTSWHNWHRVLNSFFIIPAISFCRIQEEIFTYCDSFDSHREPFVINPCHRDVMGHKVKLIGCKSALNPPVVYSTDCSKAVVPVLVLFFVALWFILRGDLFEGLPCVILFLCFSVLLALRLPRLGKWELTWVLFVRWFDLRLFGFVCFPFLLVSGKGFSLWLWHSLDFSLTFFGMFTSGPGPEFMMCGDWLLLLYHVTDYHRPRSDSTHIQVVSDPY